MLKERTAINAAEAVLRPPAQELVDAWRIIVEANAEQEARLREFDPPEDPYAPDLTPEWRQNWHTMVENAVNEPGPPVLAIQSFARMDETWLDAGAGTARHAISLSPLVNQIRVVDPSIPMTGLMRENVALYETQNVEVLDPSPWPPAEPLGAADVCLSVFVYNFVADIGGFLDAMESHANRLCLLQAAELGTAWQPDHRIFEELHGEPFVRMPGVRELLAVLGARRTRFEIQHTSDFPEHNLTDIESLHRHVRRWYLVREGSEKDRRLRDLLIEHCQAGDGQYQHPQMAGTYQVIISWEPPAK